MDMSVLEQQVAMEGGGATLSGAPMAATDEPVLLPGMDRRMPNLLAAAVIGSVVTLVALRAAGFRFSFGASVGTGA